MCNADGAGLECHAGCWRASDYAMRKPNRFLEVNNDQIGFFGRLLEVMCGP